MALWLALWFDVFALGRDTTDCIPRLSRGNGQDGQCGYVIGWVPDWRVETLYD